MGAERLTERRCRTFLRNFASKKKINFCLPHKNMLFVKFKKKTFVRHLTKKNFWFVSGKKNLFATCAKKNFVRYFKTKIGLPRVKIFFCSSHEKVRAISIFNLYWILSLHDQNMRQLPL
jgi:hypothetical protein